MNNKSQQEMDALKSITTEQEETKSLGKVNKKEMLNPKGPRDARLSFLKSIEVHKDSMLYKGKFYPEDWVFKARPATGEEIVAISTINPDDALSVDAAINEIIRCCITIKSKKLDKVISTENIFEFDRLWFLLFIRDLTISNRESQIKWSIGCKHCENPKMDIELTFNNLIEKPFTEIADKYFDASTQSFQVKTKSFGVIKIQPTTIKRANIYKEYFRDCSEKNINPDMKFLSLFNMMINSDNENEDKIMNKLYNIYMSIINDVYKLSLYKKLQEELVVGIEDTIVHVCEKCGKEGHYDIRFPNGINNIFIMSDFDSELL